MLVNSHERPPKIEYKQGKKLVNFNIQEKTSSRGIDEEELYYEFHRLKLPLDTSGEETTRLVNIEKTRLVDLEIKSYASKYSFSEQNTFWVQELEAKNYREGSSDTQFITLIAENRGIPLGELVSKIEANSAALREATATTLGQYQASLSETFD